MTTNYEDQVAALEEEKESALSEVDEKYGGRIEQTDAMFQKQIDAVQDYADKQSELQQKQTDFTIGQIQQQKEQAQKDYIKEQSAAYVDFKKQTDPHGVKAERIAAGGMWGSGYSESSQTAMYNEYQQRVSTAKASFDQTIVNYNNAMAQAELQNSSVLAEIAFNALVQETELTMQAFVSRNTLLDEQENARAQVEKNYLSAVGQLQGNGVSDEAVEKWIQYAKKQHPDGVVTDTALWNQLRAVCDERVLNAAGLYGPEGKTTGGSNAAGYGIGPGITTENGVFIPTGGVVGHYHPGKTTKVTESTKDSTQSTGSSLEDQLITLGYSGITEQELLLLVNSGEIIATRHPDGTYTLEKGKKKTSWTSAAESTSEKGKKKTSWTSAAGSTLDVNKDVEKAEELLAKREELYDKWLNLPDGEEADAVWTQIMEIDKQLAAMKQR